MYKRQAANTAATAEEVYNDDIYVGYRFFDTFGKKVAYEFGYGESYTDFDIKVKTVKADAENVSVVAEVKNTGKVTGKEVVEVYFSAPEAVSYTHLIHENVPQYGSVRVV